MGGLKDTTAISTEHFRKVEYACTRCRVIKPIDERQRQQPCPICGTPMQPNSIANLKLRSAI